MGVEPAGIEMANTGHHHLLIDLDVLPDKNLPIPSDEKHRHFGAGQTETSINLTQGTHTLQLMLGDHYHMQHEETVVSKKITICFNSCYSAIIFTIVNCIKTYRISYFLSPI